MTSYKEIFDRNKNWAAKKKSYNKDFFKNLAKGQDPDFLYIGCSDSRVSTEELMGVEPGEVFVHRNIGNVVNSNDLNIMSVINYGISVLEIKHLIVCGHYNCGGVKAAMESSSLDALEPWLDNIREVYKLNKKEIDNFQDEEKRLRRMVELNVEEQCNNLIKIDVLKKSFEKNSYPIIHGWIFDIHSGELIDINYNFQDKFKQFLESPHS